MKSTIRLWLCIEVLGINRPFENIHVKLKILVIIHLKTLKFRVDLLDIQSYMYLP